MEIVACRVNEKDGIDEMKMDRVEHENTTEVLEN